MDGPEVSLLEAAFTGEGGEAPPQLAVYAGAGKLTNMVRLWRKVMAARTALPSQDPIK